MQHESEAGLEETGLGRLPDDKDLLARRMAAVTVRRKCNTHACTKPQTGVCGHERHDEDVEAMGNVLGMLGLPLDFSVPTDEERSALFENLPRHVHFSMSTVDAMLVPEKRPDRF